MAPHYRLVGTGMSVLSLGRHTWYVTSHRGQLSLLPCVGWEIRTGQSAVMHCGWGSKAGWLLPLSAWVDKHVGGK